MANINSLAPKTSDPQALNQSVRWIVTKEKHADDIIDIVASYMLAQRVKRELFHSEHEYLDALGECYSGVVDTTLVVTVLVLCRLWLCCVYPTHCSAYHHKVMQAAMKAKQSTDSKAINALQNALNDLTPMYTK